nr:oxidoreductase [Streptomyces sp. NBC_00830]
MTTENSAPGGLLPLAPGLEVSRIGFGAMQLPGPGAWGPSQDPAAAVAVLRRAAELGVTHIDTSDFYGPHVANDLIREALFPYFPELVIATKVGVVRDEWRAWNAAAQPSKLREQVEENLSRLGKDRLDLVYLRVGGDGLLFPDRTPFAESFGALADLQRRGLIHHLGLSGATAAQLTEARQLAPVAAVQNRFHLFDRSSNDVLAACEEQGTAFVPYFPLSAGMLRRGLDKSQAPPGMAPSDDQEHTLDEVAARHGATRTQTVLAWLLARSPVILAIPGTKSVAHLEENVAASDLRLTEDDVIQLDKLA